MLPAVPPGTVTTGVYVVHGVPLSPVPPRATDSVPAQPAVMLEAANNAVAGDPPSVSVTLVSSVLVSAAGTPRRKLPLPVVEVKVGTPAENSGTPDCALTSVPKPPRAAASVPVQPNVRLVA